MPSDPEALLAAMRANLKVALRQRDRVTATALRTLMAAIANAEAVPTDPLDHPVSVGFHADSPRRRLDAATLRGVVQGEIDDFMRAAAEFQALGETERASQLEEMAAVADHYLDWAPGRA